MRCSGTTVLTNWAKCKFHLKFAASRFPNGMDPFNLSHTNVDSIKAHLEEGLSDPRTSGLDDAGSLVAIQRQLGKLSQIHSMITFKYNELARDIERRKRMVEQLNFEYTVRRMALMERELPVQWVCFGILIGSLSLLLAKIGVPT